MPRLPSTQPSARRRSSLHRATRRRSRHSSPRPPACRRSQARTGERERLRRDGSALLSRLAAAPPALRVKAEQVLVASLKFELDRLRLILRPRKITRETLPSDLTRNWVGANGAA